MTGEMHRIDRDGNDSNGESWPTHAYVARSLRRPLRPFDKYAGPYIACKEGRLWLSSDDGYSIYACLWPDGIASAYCEPIVVRIIDPDSDESALIAARECLRQYRKAKRTRA